MRGASQSRATKRANAKPITLAVIVPTITFLATANGARGLLELRNKGAIALPDRPYLDDRIAAGAMARYAVSDSVTLNFRGEHVWTRENERTAPKAAVTNRTIQT